MDELIKRIINIGYKNKINKIILFGSRSRGDYTDKSDYDIAFVSNNILKNGIMLMSKLDIKLNNYI